MIATFFHTALYALLLVSSGGLFVARSSGPSLTYEYEPPEVRLQVGEWLEYEVSYSFITLGTIRIEVIDSDTSDGRTVYKTRAFIDSAPGLPFVKLNYVYVSEMDEGVYSHRFHEENVSSKEKVVKDFVFDYDLGRAVKATKYLAEDGALRRQLMDTILITDKVQDGASLFYFARKNIFLAKPATVQIVVDRKQETARINYRNEITSVNIDALDYPVEVRYFDGRADFVGVFGLTGAFRGWFSNDEAAVPIIARMNVILGSIYIELKHWKRQGWAPPKFVRKK